MHVAVEANQHKPPDKQTHKVLYIYMK